MADTPEEEKEIDLTTPEPIYILGNPERLFTFKTLPSLNQNEFNYVFETVQKKFVKICAQYQRDHDQIKLHSEEEEIDIEQGEDEKPSKDDIESQPDDEEEISLPTEIKEWGLILKKLPFYNNKPVIKNTSALETIILANKQQLAFISSAYFEEHFVPSAWLFKLIRSIMIIPCDIKEFSHFLYHSYQPPFIDQQKIMTLLSELYIEKDFKKLRMKVQLYMNFYKGVNDKLQKDYKMKLLFWYKAQAFISNRPLFVNQTLHNENNLRDVFWDKFNRAKEDKKKQPSESNSDVAIDYHILKTPCNPKLLFVAKTNNLLYQDAELLFLLFHVKWDSKSNSYDHYVIGKILEKILVSNEVRLGLERLVYSESIRVDNAAFLNLITVLLNMSNTDNTSQYYDTIIHIKTVLLESDGYQKAIQHIDEAVKQNPSLLNLPLVSKEKDKTRK